VLRFLGESRRQKTNFLANSQTPSIALWEVQRLLLSYVPYTTANKLIFSVFNYTLYLADKQSEAEGVKKRFKIKHSKQEWKALNPPKVTGLYEKSTCPKRTSAFFMQYFTARTTRLSFSALSWFSFWP
jgi:hypothetical protein